MDSMEKIAVTEDLSKIIDDLTIIEGSKQDLLIFTKYIDITRDLEELYQWYHIFNYNFDKAISLYPNGEPNAINSHIIALVSAGKNIIDFMERFNDIELNNKQKLDFKTEYLSKEYDNHFSYRFITRLRNFTQHGHIPVSFLDSDPCFDLTQIYETPHFKFNSTLKMEAMQLIDDVRNKYGDILKLAYLPTIYSYGCSLYRIFIAFMDITDSVINSHYNTFKQTVEETPEMTVHRNHPEFKGSIFFIIEGENQLHCLNTYDDPIKVYIKIKNDSINRYNNLQKQLDKLKKYKIINSDKKQLSQF